MPQASDRIDLAKHARKPGEGARLELDVALAPVAIGDGALRPEPPVVPVALDVSRTAAGYALHLRFEGGVAGECMRCLEPAHVAVGVDAIEVDQRGTRDEEFKSPYVDGDELDLDSWANDAFVLGLPAKIVCSPDCPGLCPECGEPLRSGEHDHPREPDPRWAKLRELG